MKTRIGLVGCGGIGEVHLDAYKNIPDAEIYALCDIDEKRLHAYGEKYGVTRLYTDVREMVKLEELDAIDVCTWNAAHCPCVLAGLEAGKHVFCEKPMAMNVEEAERMEAAAKKAGKLLMIGFVRRFGADMDIIRDFAKTGYFGDFYYAKATYLRRNGNPGGWFGNKELSGGGPLIDLGIHVIDYVRYAMGNPKAVSVYGCTYQKLFDRPGIKHVQKYKSRSATDHDICDVEDLAAAMIRFDNGATLSVEASFALNMPKNEGVISIFGDKAGLREDDDKLAFYTEENKYLTNVEFADPSGFGFGNAFECELSHYVKCIRTGEECRNPAEDGVELMRILRAIYESAETGHEVIIKR